MGTTDNHRETIFAVDNITGLPFVIKGDASTGAINVSGGASGGGDGAILDGVSAGIKATVLDLTSANPLTVAITDGTGAQITSFGGGTQYADGAVRGTSTGTIMMVDDGTNIQSAKGDAAGRLEVNINGTVPVSGTFFQATQPVSAAALPLPTGAATSALQTQPGVDIGDVTINNAAGASAVNIQDGGNSLTVDNAGFTVQAQDGAGNAIVTTTTDPSAASRGLIVRSAPGTNIIGKVGIDQTTPGTTNLVALTAETTKVIGVVRTADGSGNLLTSTTNALDINLKTSSITLPVSLSSTTVTGTVTTKETRSATPAQTSPSITTASTSILASNANRLGFTIYNEGTATCYMKLGATASLTSYTCQIASGGYYECPFNYTGAVDGITSASTAQLRVTELT